jgi:hypothetical protein
VDKSQAEKNDFKELKTKLILGTLKYAAWIFNILIIFGVLYGVVSYILFIMESTH